MAREAILLFDGVCNLCNAAVDFVIARDGKGRFRFAALQSPAAIAVLAAHGHPTPAAEPDTMLLIEDGRVFERSAAALRVARHLGGPWPALAVGLGILPRPLRDAAYRWIARNRLRWFGRRDRCRMPSPELVDRFLS